MDASCQNGHCRTRSEAPAFRPACSYRPLPRSHTIRSRSPGDRPSCVSRTAASARNCVPWFTRCVISCHNGCAVRLPELRLRSSAATPAASSVSEAGTTPASPARRATSRPSAQSRYLALCQHFRLPRVPQRLRRLAALPARRPDDFGHQDVYQRRVQAAEAQPIGPREVVSLRHLRRPVEHKRR